jgi:hypothetical protein
VVGKRELLQVGLVAGLLMGGLVIGTPGSGAARSGAAELRPSARATARSQGSVTIIQAVPGVEMTAAVDGDDVGKAIAAGAVVSLPPLAPGQHEVEFAFDGGAVSATIDVRAGASTDVVVHRPAEVGGDPTLSVYPTPTNPIGPGKARVVLAHTATTAPADVEVDGQVVFTNIANGEYAEADVASGSHRVALLPSGVTGPPILGPLDVRLKAHTLTAIYAVGNPRNRSMNVIVHEIRLKDDGSEAPTLVNTGSAGLAAELRVLTFVAGG